MTRVLQSLQDVDQYQFNVINSYAIIRMVIIVHTFCQHFGPVMALFKFAGVYYIEHICKPEQGPNRTKMSMECVHYFDHPDYCT